MQPPWSVPGRGVGDPPVRPRHHPVDERSAGRGDDRRAARLARRADRLRRAHPGPRGLRRRRSSTPASRPAIVAGMGGSSLAPDVLHRTFGTPGGLPRPAHPRFDRPGGRRGHRRRPRPARGRSSSSPASRARRPSRTPSSPTPGHRAEAALDAVEHHVYEQPGRVRRRDHRPGQEPRGDPPPRRLPRGLPQPARHRRALLGADLRRARAGVAHRPRPRRAARVGDGDARRLPRAGPRRQPGRLARARASARSRRPAATS